MTPNSSRLSISIASRAEPLTPAARPEHDGEEKWALCDAYKTLRGQIERYARGEILGQSILVAGHRGSGKTTLVHLAIQQVQWLAEGKVPPPSRELEIELSGVPRPSSAGKLTGKTRFEEVLEYPLTLTFTSNAEGCYTLKMQGLHPLLFRDEFVLNGTLEGQRWLFCNSSEVDCRGWRKTRVVGELTAHLKSSSAERTISGIHVDVTIDWECKRTARIYFPAEMFSGDVDKVRINGLLQVLVSRPFAAIPFLVPLHGPDLFLSPTNPSVDDGRSLAEEALSQIRKAIHRAFAEEVARRYSAESALSGVPQLLEAATQLHLELDQTPSLPLLAMYWERGGYLARGVLGRFRDSAGRISRNRSTDAYAQGLREILALHTAIESIHPTEKNRVDQTPPQQSRRKKPLRSAQPEDGNKTRSSEHPIPELDLKLPPDRLQEAVRLAAPILSLLAGAFAAHAVIETLGPITAGAIAAITVLLAYSFLSRTIPNRADATLTGDPSVGSQDLLLPLLIERAVDAGLAPIFVVDELDKIQGDLGVKLDALMKRLKYLVTDRAFFCFLADRLYYEQFQQQVKTQPYPIQDTYYADRLLIYHRHDELHRFLKLLFVSDQPNEVENLSIQLLPYLAQLQSYAHLGALSRVIKENSENERVRFGGGLQSLWMSAGYRLAIVMQVSIESICARPLVAARLHQEPHFTQWLYDALYHFPREWRKDAGQVSYRQRASATATEAPTVLSLLHSRFYGEKTPIGNTFLGLDEREVTFLFDQMEQLALLLARPHELAFDLLRRGRAQDTKWPPAVAALVFESSPMITDVGVGDDRKYYWLFDEYGRPIAEALTFFECAKWVDAVEKDRNDAALHVRFEDLLKLDTFMEANLGMYIIDVVSVAKRLPKSAAAARFLTVFENKESLPSGPLRDWMPNAETFLELVKQVYSPRLLTLVGLECLLRTEWRDLFLLLSIASVRRSNGLPRKSILEDLFDEPQYREMTLVDWAAQEIIRITQRDETTVYQELTSLARRLTPRAIRFLVELS